MTETIASLLTPWAAFYTMTGSAAAALTGLMFVVITLVTGVDRERKRPDGISTFSTPTVVHFGTVLSVSALLAAPWHALTYLGILLGIIGVCGLAYTGRVIFRARTLSTYTPDLEDWTWFWALPLVAYGAILAGAIALFTVPAGGLYALAAGTALLILIGIRNAWDVVTFLAIGGNDEPDDPAPN